MHIASGKKEKKNNKNNSSNSNNNILEMLTIPLYRSSEDTSAMESLGAGGRSRGSPLLSQP